MWSLSIHFGRAFLFLCSSYVGILASGVTNRLNLADTLFLFYGLTLTRMRWSYTLCAGVCLSSCLGLLALCFFIFLITIPLSIYILFLRMKIDSFRVICVDWIGRKMLPVALLCALGAIPLSQAASGSILWIPAVSIKETMIWYGMESVILV